MQKRLPRRGSNYVTLRPPSQCCYLERRKCTFYSFSVELTFWIPDSWHWFWLKMVDKYIPCTRVELWIQSQLKSWNGKVFILQKKVLLHAFIFRSISENRICVTNWIVHVKMVRFLVIFLMKLIETQTFLWCWWVAANERIILEGQWVS